MKKLCAKGFKLSKEDRLALDHSLAGTPQEWATSALAGLINKAVKTIFKDWLPLYRTKQNENYTVDLSILIPDILAMPEFKPYNRKSPENEKPSNKGPRNDEVWSGGFDIEDHEEMALKAFYGDPEQVLNDLMDNKIALRKEAFVKEHTAKFMADPAVTIIPINQDDLINFAVAKPGYKNRKQRDAEV